MPRHDQRQLDEIRPLSIQRQFTGSAAGSVLIKCGRTTVLCTASLENSVPPWKQTDDPEKISGWVTAEYNMLPGSTSPRKPRDRKNVDGRTTEIQRLIGRSLRAVVDFKALGARTITIDCDVLEADGGTRTTSITGGFVALVDAIQAAHQEDPTLVPGKVLTSAVAAISVGIVDDQVVTDLDYVEDSRAEVDSNIVMTSEGRFVEVQGTAEGRPFTMDQLQQQLGSAQKAIHDLFAAQREALGENWPWHAEND